MNSVDQYLANVKHETFRAELERIRKIIKETVPDSTETISYGMPVSKLNGKYLLGYSAFANHMSIFPGSEPIAVLKSELAPYKTAKGTIQFTLEQPIAADLLKKILEECKRRIVVP